MAQEAVNAVVQAFQRGMEQVQAIQARKQQKEEYESTLAQHKTEFDAQQKQQDIQNQAAEKLFKATQAHQDAMLALSRMQAGQQAAINYSQFGALPPGATATLQPQQISVPGTESQAQGPFVNIPGQQIPSTMTIAPRDVSKDTSLLNIPGVGPVETATPEALAARTEILQRPAREAMRAEKAAESQERITLEIKRQEEETKRYLAQIDLQKTYDAEKDKRDIEGRESIARMETAERLRAAAIQATGGLSELGNLFGTAKGTNQITPNASTGAPQVNVPGPLGATINQSLTNIFKGTDSLERQEKVNPKLKQMISSAAAMGNIGSLTDADVKELHDLQLMSAAAPILKQMHELKLTNPNQIYTPGTAAFSKFTTLQGQLDTMIPKIATSMSSSKRMSEPELKRYFDGYSPSRMPTQRAADENQKYNKFIIQDLWGRGKDIVQGLPENQQNAILTQYGFTGLPSTIVTPPKIIHWQRNPGTGKLEQVIQ